MKHRYGLRHGLLGLSLLLLLSAQTSLPRTEVWIGRGDSQEEIARFTVEVADTPETWEHGLMERASLAQTPACCLSFQMLPSYLLDDEHAHPLDMLFIDANHRVINIRKMLYRVRPWRLPTYNSHSTGQIRAGNPRWPRTCSI